MIATMQQRVIAARVIAAGQQRVTVARQLRVIAERQPRVIATMQPQPRVRTAE